jgi:hemoglobin-like flavoprotein
MITDEEKLLIKDSWRLGQPSAESVADLFYRRLFELKPEYRSLFSGGVMEQKQKLLAMLGFVVKSLDWQAKAWRDEIDQDDDLFLVMLSLGRRHTDLYRVPDDGYEIMGAALLWALGQGLGKQFDASTRAAWDHLYALIASAMKMGRLSGKDRGLVDDAVDRIVARPGGPS